MRDLWKTVPVCVCVCVCVCILSCVWLCDPKDYSSPGSSCPRNFPGKNTGMDCHFLLQGSSQPRDWTCISSISRRILCHLLGLDKGQELQILCSYGKKKCMILTLEHTESELGCNLHALFRPERRKGLGLETFYPPVWEVTRKLFIYLDFEEEK